MFVFIVFWYNHKLRHLVALPGAFFFELFDFSRRLKITFWQQIQNLREICCRLAPELGPEVLSASSYGCTKVWIEFWSQCLIFRFRNYVCFIVLCLLRCPGLLSFVLKWKSWLFQHLRNQGRMQIFEKMSQKPLNHVLRLLRHRSRCEDSEIFRIFWKRCHFCRVNTWNTAAKEFRSQCLIFRFGRYTSQSIPGIPHKVPSTPRRHGTAQD